MLMPVAYSAQKWPYVWPVTSESSTKAVVYYRKAIGTFPLDQKTLGHGHKQN